MPGGEGRRASRPGEGADAELGEQEEGRPQDAAQGGDGETGCGRAAVQGRLCGEGGDDGAGQGRTPPGQPGPLRLQTGVPVGAR
ncbi:hypothetical protein GCM10009549_20380 [Streptomyces thermoalcalitolerans]|uniref:Uncharacterized protein n=1 Tax=Streptomyces thermoalcalitolerans TaxID=65605 RepID=A0ABN1NL14_9ACTN